MEARLLLRTHYQVDEPCFVTVLCKVCVSAASTAYHETVAQKLTKEVRARNKEFNAAAGGYVVDLGKALGVITRDQALADKGQLVVLFGTLGGERWDDQLALTDYERLVYFKLFLEADGAAFVFLANEICEHEVIPRPGTDWNTLATDMFVDAYRRYTEITNNTADRVKLRALRDRLQAQPYTGRGGAHKMFVHLQTMYRLGLVRRLDGGLTRTYGAPREGGRDPGRLALFREHVPDVVALERVIQRQQWAEIAAATLLMAGERASVATAPLEEERLLTEMSRYYKRILDSGAPLCPLGVLMDAVQVEALARDSLLLPNEALINALASAQKTRPKDIRFHVDRRGRPAFIKLSEALLAECSVQSQSDE